MQMGVFAILSGKLFYVKSNKAKVTFMAADIQFHYIEKHKSFDKFCYANKLYRLKTSALAMHKFCQNFVAFTTQNFLRGRFWAHAEQKALIILSVVESSIVVLCNERTTKKIGRIFDAN